MRRCWCHGRKYIDIRPRVSSGPRLTFQRLICRGWIILSVLIAAAVEASCPLPGEAMSRLEEPVAKRGNPEHTCNAPLLLHHPSLSPHRAPPLDGAGRHRLVHSGRGRKCARATAVTAGEAVKAGGGIPGHAKERSAIQRVHQVPAAERLLGRVGRYQRQGLVQAPRGAAGIDPAHLYPTYSAGFVKGAILRSRSPARCALRCAVSLVVAYIGASRRSSSPLPPFYFT